MKTLILFFALLISMCVALFAGTVPVGFEELSRFLDGTLDDGLSTILLEIRLPRIVLAVIVGAGIASSGAAIQGLFRNPLADPALIGVSAGAALFASLYVVFGASAPLGLAFSAFIGGLSTTWLVLYVGGRGASISTMLLAGIAINAIALSGVGLLSYLSTDAQLRTISFWALGSLNGADWTLVLISLVIPVSTILLFTQSQPLNVVTLGDEEAEHLGVSHQKLRRRIILLAALSVGVGVALTGVIAFLGLVVPHLVRMMFGSNHQVVIPGSAILGGILLLFADTCARSMRAPAELPVGIITALVGGPFFVYLLMREQSNRVLV